MSEGCKYVENATSYTHQTGNTRLRKYCLSTRIELRSHWFLLKLIYTWHSFYSWKKKAAKQHYGDIDDICSCLPMTDNYKFCHSAANMKKKIPKQTDAWEQL